MKLVCVAICCAVLATGAPARPQTASPTPPPTLGVPSGVPVQLESCNLESAGNELVAKTVQIAVQFTNESAVVADLIRFRFKWGEDSSAYVRDVGTFSPGITIIHKFKQASGEIISPLLTRPKVRCSIEAIHFVDNTVWMNPNAGPNETTATQSLHP